ncbi:VirB3 family type IV secretion system protein [Stenoxybacter acetivorans]|uniref:VirB3 family type IV secretion system protein n=1 Tax=Stenoxybacter acetivorans TaxID=422441 RepID=UPI00068CF966|nr:VirB3 family type IV secretion system protein [Stenoxybacter acetivorans]
MAEESTNINTEYSAYNALAREAMFFGIPIVAFGMCIGAATLLALIAMQFVGLSGLLLFGLCLPVLLFLKTICASDTQAMRKIAAEVKWFFRRKNAQLFNSTTTILSTKYGRQFDDYQRFFEKNS